MSSTSEQSIFLLVNYSVSCEMEQKIRDHSLSTRSKSRKRDSPVTMRPALDEHADSLEIMLHLSEPVSIQHLHDAKTPTGIPFLLLLEPDNWTIWNPGSWIWLPDQTVEFQCFNTIFFVHLSRK